MKELKKMYESPEALVICLEAVDVITSSVFTDSNVMDDGWIGV